MKRKLQIIGVGLAVGIILVVIQTGCAIPRDIFLKNYFAVAAVIVILMGLFNISYNFLYYKKMKKAFILLQNGRPREYVEQMERIKGTAKGRALKRLLDINLSAGYYDLKQYDKAIVLLEPIDAAKGDLQIVRLINLCLCYFRTQQNEKAMILYDQGKDKLHQAKQIGKYTENIMILEIFVAIEKKELSLVGELLEAMENKVTDEGIKMRLLEIRESFENSLAKEQVL